MSEFDLLAMLARKHHDYVAVCRAKHGDERMFTVPFETEEQLGDFLKRNNGDVHEMGFYAKGFAEGEYVGENT